MVMEKRLYRAAAEGNVPYLLKLLRDDPFLLDRSVAGCYIESPLHVASLLGHLEFVNEILSRKPELASELDSQGSSPLHLAAAKGYVSIVKSLLVANPEMCFSRDKFGRNPIHISAIKGRVDVLKEMVRVSPGGALQRMSNGDTILHLCVRNNRLDCLLEIVGRLGDRELVNAKNGEGDTILHLAAADQQNQTITFLINNTNIDTSSPNQRGLIALDILARANIEKIQVPINCAAFRNKIMPTAETAPAMDHPLQERGQQRKDLKEGKDWPEKMRSALMVVASLTATMAFQVGVNPPSGFWQDTTQEGGQSCSLNGGSSTKAVTYPPSSSGVCTPPHKAGSSIMANNDPASYTILLAINTTSFIASLSIILLLISGFTLRQRFFVWILMVIMWVAITCNALTYINSIAAFTPNPVRSNVVNVLRFITLVWGGLMVLLLAIHTVRLVMWLVRNIARKRNKRASSTFSTDA